MVGELPITWYDSTDWVLPTFGASSGACEAVLYLGSIAGSDEPSGSVRLYVGRCRVRLWFLWLMLRLLFGADGILLFWESW